jgi:hypothetical protein
MMSWISFYGEYFYVLTDLARILGGQRVREVCLKHADSIVCDFCLSLGGWIWVVGVRVGM